MWRVMSLQQFTILTYFTPPTLEFMLYECIHAYIAQENLL